MKADKKRTNKSSKHHHGEKRLKSRSRRAPEVVVVCRYPPSTSQNTTSYEGTMRTEGLSSQHPFVQTTKTDISASNRAMKTYDQAAAASSAVRSDLKQQTSLQST